MNNNDTKDSLKPISDQQASESPENANVVSDSFSEASNADTQKESAKESDKVEKEPTYFEDLALSDDVLDALYDMHFEKCTPVQAACIPPILEHRDVLGVAQTGTGKTAAYLLPLLSILCSEAHPEDAVNCLVIAPTRELARQIDQALQGFAFYTNINAVAVYGGNDGARYEQERRSLQAGADIVLATPGRLITHLQLGTLDLSRTTHLVLDEADRMLDMGFAEDIMSIVKQMPPNRQTILFSATMPPKIAQLARSVMHNPVEVEIAVSKPAENIQQSVFVCRESDKVIILKNIFDEKPPKRVILFASSKQKVKELAIVLKRKGLNVRAMHSDLSQPERDEVMQLFRAHKVDLLVATDIVARGIDIDDITMVINYDAPHDAEDYVHRIGRTARAGREGVAITLIGEKDQPALASIERILKIKIKREKLPNGLKQPEAKAHNSHGNRNEHKQRRASRDGNKHGGQQPNSVKPNVTKGRSPQKSAKAQVHGDRPRSEKPVSGKMRQHRGRGGRKAKDHTSKTE